jgi:hypothetical protein
VKVNGFDDFVDSCLEGKLINSMVNKETPYDFIVLEENDT